MVKIRRRDRDLGVRTAARIVAVLMVVFFASSCATHRVPAAYQTMAEVQRATCDDFARAEVKRLGESVPGALVKGFVIGLALDMSWALETVQLTYGARPPGPLPDEPPFPATPPRGAVPPTSWAVGGSQLARDAARTNEDVYEQAIQTCMAPVRLAEEFGRRDARVAASLELLADCYGWQHRYAQAEPLRREAVAIWEGVFGPNDQRVARALDDHARVLRLLHRAEEAESQSQHAAMIRAAVGSSRTPTPGPTLGLSPDLACHSPFSATLFVLCRGIPHDQNGDRHPPVERP